MTFCPHIRFVSLAVVLSCFPFGSNAVDTITTDEDDVFLQAVEHTRLREERLEKDILADDIISYAGTFIGRPYRRGGKGPKAFDCSGFTRYIFSHFNTHIGASSRSQFLQGEEIARSDIRPGDLVFFSSHRSGNKVGHVGIAVEVDSDGRIKFIHAASRGGIRIDNYPDNGYYSNHFMGARRVI